MASISEPEITRSLSSETIPKLPGDVHSGGPVIAGHHDDFDARFTASGNSLACLGTRRIGNADESDANQVSFQFLGRRFDVRHFPAGGRRVRARAARRPPDRGWPAARDSIGARFPLASSVLVETLRMASAAPLTRTKG
jgi:hypothetical protein